MCLSLIAIISIEVSSLTITGPGMDWTGYGVDTDRKVVVEFSSKYCDESRFLFGPDIYQELMAFCRGLDELLELQRRPSESGVAQARLHDCENRASRIRKLMDAVLRQEG